MMRFQLFPIFNELYDNTQKRMNIVIGSAIGSAAMTYEVIAVFGYLTFGSKVGDSRHNLETRAYSVFVRSERTLSRCTRLHRFSLPSANSPSSSLSYFRIRCKSCLAVIVLDKVFYDSKTLVIKPVSGEEEEVEGEEDDEFHHEMSWFKHFVLTAGIVICGFTIAYFVDDLHLGEP